MAKIIAMKNKATSAINGEVSSDGLSALLGEDGDLRSLLLKSVKEGKTLKGSAEDWISQTTDRAREILAGIGKKKAPAAKSLQEQFAAWCKQEELDSALRPCYQPLIQAIGNGEINGFTVVNGVLTVDYEKAFGFDKAFISANALKEYLLKHIVVEDITTEETVLLPSEQVADATQPEVKKSATPLPAVKETIKVEQELNQKVVVLKDVKKGTKSKRKKVTSENQLVFDLFA